MQRLIHRQRLRRMHDQHQQHALRRGRGQVRELALILEHAALGADASASRTRSVEDWQDPR